MSRPSRARHPPPSFAPTIDFTKSPVAPSTSTTAAAATQKSKIKRGETSESEEHEKDDEVKDKTYVANWRMRTGRKTLRQPVKVPLPTPSARAMPARMSKSIAIVASASPDSIQRDYLVDDQPAIRAAIRLSQEKAEKQARLKRKSRASKDSEEEEEEEDDDNEGDEWIVEKIVAVRPDRNGVKYQVRWRGFSAQEDTFEPFEHIKDTEAYIRFMAVKQTHRESTTPAKIASSPVKKKRKPADDDEEEEQEEEEEEEEEEAAEEEEPEETTASKKQQASKSASSAKVSSSVTRRPPAQLPPSPPDSTNSSRASSPAPPVKKKTKTANSSSSTASSSADQSKYIASSYSLPESTDKLVPPMPVPAAEPSPSDGQLAPLFSSRFNVTILGKARPSHIPAEVAVYRMTQEGKLEWADAREIVKSYQEKVAVKALAAGKKHAAAAAASADRDEHKNSINH